MTDYEIKLPGELLSSRMTENTGFAHLLVLSQSLTVFFALGQVVCDIIQ